MENKFAFGQHENAKCETKTKGEPKRRTKTKGEPCLPHGSNPNFVFEIRFFCLVLFCTFRVPAYMQQVTVQSRLTDWPIPASGQLCHVLLCVALVILVILVILE